MQTFLWWFLYWKYIILLLGLILLVWVYLYMNMFRMGNVIFWKIKYITISLIILFLIFYSAAEDILGFLVTELQRKQLSAEKVQLRDPQEYTYICFEIAIFYAILFIIPLILVYIWLYLFNFWNAFTQVMGSLYFILSIYYLFLIKWFVDTDLYLSGWESDWGEGRGVYQFQPDLVLLNWFYLGEVWDISLFFMLWLISIGLYLSNYSDIWKKSLILFKIHLILLLTILFYSYYLFGGESILRDLILIIINIIFIEINYFTILFFSVLKYKK